jgi:hypothetical protein
MSYASDTFTEGPDCCRQLGTELIFLSSVGASAGPNGQTPTPQFLPRPGTPAVLPKRDIVAILRHPPGTCQGRNALGLRK